MINYYKILLVQPSYIVTGNTAQYRFWFYKQVQLLLLASQQLSTVSLGDRVTATATIQRFTNYYDTLLSIADTFFWDDFYQMLESSKRITLSYLQEIMPTLPGVVFIDIVNDMPALVISYDRYGTLDNSIDIIRRNKISNPNRIKGQIEILAI